MKRSALKPGKPLERRAVLRRSSRLKAQRKPAEANPAKHAFKELAWTACEACGAIGWCRRHHVVLEQHVRAEGGDCWDLDDGMWIGVERGITCRCHERHHNPSARGDTRIPLARVPLRAIGFAYRLFGEAYGRDYLAQRYAPVREERMAA